MKNVFLGVVTSALILFAQPAFASNACLIRMNADLARVSCTNAADSKTVKYKSSGKNSQDFFNIDSAHLDLVKELLDKGYSPVGSLKEFMKP